MKRLIGVEVDDGQAKRVVLDHPRLDFIGEGKPDRGRQILAADCLIAHRRVDDSLKIDERFVRGLVQVRNGNLANLRCGLFKLSVQ
jgi:hypothetical protein